MTKTEVKELALAEEIDELYQTFLAKATVAVMLSLKAKLTELISNNANIDTFADRVAEQVVDRIAITMSGEIYDALGGGDAMLPTQLDN